ncbi:MAG: Crp/Fnr family transcriptional regulator [Firmicutes bacterium]|nr:Crp/Fnr family transcriptional regulator [Bacillota bacterium]
MDTYEPFLRNFILFSEMSDSDLIAISALLESSSSHNGEIIFMQGDIGNNVYFIKKGKVKAVRNNVNGDEQILEILQPGDVFGEVVLFGIDEYPATAIALDEVELVFLSKMRFKEYFTANPQIAWGMLRVMAKKLYRAQRKIENLGLKDTRARVATLIIDMLIDFGETENELVLDINRQEMANYIGTSRETVSRVLSDFKNKDIIEVNGNRIFIKDFSALKEWT